MGKPRACVGPKDIARTLGMLTIEEQIANMLTEGERAESYGDAQSHADATRKIFSGNQLVGYIAVLSTDLP